MPWYWKYAMNPVHHTASLPTQACPHPLHLPHLFLGHYKCPILKGDDVTAHLWKTAELWLGCFPSPEPSLTQPWATVIRTFSGDGKWQNGRPLKWIKKKKRFCCLTRVSQMTIWIRMPCIDSWSCIKLLIVKKILGLNSLLMRINGWMETYHNFSTRAFNSTILSWMLPTQHPLHPGHPGLWFSGIQYVIWLTVAKSR